MFIKLKSDLEETYHIGFNITGIKGNYEIRLKDSDFDKFHIHVVNKDGIRLEIKGEPERHAASFLRLLNKSNRSKRILCQDLIDKHLKGELKIIINNKEVSSEEFINDATDWNSFIITYSEFPFDNDDDNIIKITNLICGMFLSLVDYHIEGYAEGNIKKSIVTKYERNPINRLICLKAKGYKCAICGFDFQEVYGPIGKNTIEVHHIKPVSIIGENYIIDPIEDLVPVCSNCHTIIHKRSTPFTVDEVKNMIHQNKSLKD